MFVSARRTQKIAVAEQEHMLTQLELLSFLFHCCHRADKCFQRQLREMAVERWSELEMEAQGQADRILISQKLHTFSG